MSSSSSASRSTTNLSPKISLRTKLTYPFAEIGSQLIWTTVGSYLMLFYTDVALIAPATAGTILLIARVFDGVQDLGFGYLAERTMTRWGRFRPWIMFGSPFLTLMMITTFWSPSGAPTAKAWYAAITYIILCFVYTVVIMSYGSLPGVMTMDSRDRLTLNWLRSLGGGFAQVLLSATTMPLLLTFSHAGAQGYDARGFLITMSLFGVIALPLLIITTVNTKEVIVPAPDRQHIPFGETMRAIFTNRPLLMLFLTLLLNLTGLFGRLGMLAFYVIYNMGSPAQVAVIFTTFSVCGFIGTALFTNLAQRFNKAVVIQGALATTGLALLGIYLLPEPRLAPVLVLTVVLGLSTFTQPILLSMVPDCVDYYDWKHGVRADGTSYAITSLSTKIASAFGGAVGLYIIGWFGYVGGAQQQTAEALNGINLATNLVPSVLAFLAIIPMLFFGLSHEKMTAISADLETRLSSKTGSIADETADIAPQTVAPTGDSL